MTDIPRRRFLRSAGTATAGLMATAWAVPQIKAAGTAERVTIGVIGCKRGRVLAEEFAGLGARVAYACDVDDARAAALRKEVGADHAVADLRRVLDDPAVDAVAIATPDHWHAAAAILACEAGKHVYVEKPCSHNIREGRLMVDAARRTGRVMQVGSQSRGTTMLANGIRQLREGAIGEVLMAKASNSQRRTNIGHCRPSEPPPGFDYDLWVGPAPMRPFQENCHHYTWHWWYDFGTGDVGNDGIHELDIALWGLDVDGLPTVVSGHGSKLYFDDDQQFPDTQYVTYEFPAAKDRSEGDSPIFARRKLGQSPSSSADPNQSGRKVLVYEQRIWSPYTEDGHENCTVFYGTEGYLVVAKESGWQLFGEKNKLIREERGKYSVGEHAADFLDAIRTGKTPVADIAIGHRSATLAHLGNMLARTGRGALRFDPASEHIIDDPEADALIGRTYREGHWSVPKGA